MRMHEKLQGMWNALQLFRGQKPAVYGHLGTVAVFALC